MMAFTLGIFAHTTLGPFSARESGILMPALVSTAGIFVDFWRYLTQSHPEAGFRNATMTRTTNENSTANFILREKKNQFIENKQHETLEYSQKKYQLKIFTLGL